MAHYRSAGLVPRKRHTQHRRPDGGLYYEELVGEEGFSSDSSLVYHAHVPSAIVDARPWELPDQRTVPNAPLLPRHLALHELFPAQEWKSADAVTGRRLVLGNADVRLSYVVAGETSPLYRNATGDECVYVESGTARVETAFGHLDVGLGDYVVLPRATVHRWVPTGDEPLRLHAVEANSHITPPRRYLSKFGQLLEHAPYCERDLRGPSVPETVDQTDVEVYIKHRGNGPSGLAGSVHVVPEHPFDVVGWDGCLYPYAFNISDFEPITGRVHQPPPVHQVFEAHNFVICNFVPRTRCRAGALLPLQRRQLRGHVLRRRRLRGAQGERHRPGLDQPAPRRAQPRAAARCGGAQPRRRVLRRAGRHGRHVPAARAR